MTATDPSGAAGRASVTVRVVDVNEGPAFEPATYTFTLDEETRAPPPLGRVTATDPDGDPFTYALTAGDGDPPRFHVDASNGVVTYIGPGEDFETGPTSYALTVTATDLSGAAGRASVIVRIIDVNDRPMFDPASYAFAVDEGVRTPPPLGRVTATDQDGDALTYALTAGAGDPPRFAVDASGGVVTYIGPGEDFETGPTRYALTVTATDPEEAAATATVAVAVVNVDEPGTVTLSSVAPLVGQVLQAELTDEDGGVTDLIWSWEWTAEADNFVAIPDATAASYTPGLDALGRRLRAVARYADAQGGGKQSRSEATAPVRLDPAARAAAVEASLAAFGRTVATATAAAVEDRFEGTGAAAGRWRASVGGLAVDRMIHGAGSRDVRLAGALTSLGGLLGIMPRDASPAPGDPHGRSARAGHLRAADRGSAALRRRLLRDRLARSAFELGIGRPAQSQEEASGPRAGLTVWGRGDVSRFAGAPEDGLELDGDTLTVLVGSDYRWSPRGLVGVAVAHAQGAIRYSSTLAGDAMLDTRLVTVQPYVYLSPRPNLGVWGLAGIGWGGLDLTDSEFQGAATLDADLAARTAAAGVRRTLASTGAVSWALKADGVMVGLTTAAVEGLPAVDAASSRLRAVVEGRAVLSVSPSLRIRPSFEMGARHDGGSADTGGGLEVGGGLAMEHLPSGVRLAAQARYLVTHQAEAFEEWGAGFTFRIDPGQAGRGLAVTLAPRWGEAGRGGAQALWLAERQMARHVGVAGRPPGSLTLRQEVSYGFGIGSGGLVAPLAGIDLDAWGRRRLQAGARLAVGRASGAGLHLDVLGEQTTRQVGRPDYRLGFFGSWSFGAGEKKRSRLPDRRSDGRAAAGDSLRASG